MIREFGHFATLSALVLSLQREGNPRFEDLLGSKLPDSPSEVYLAEGFRGVLRPGLEMESLKAMGRNRLRNGHVPMGINPARLNKIDLLYPETR